MKTLALGFCICIGVLICLGFFDAKTDPAVTVNNAGVQIQLGFNHASEWVKK